MANNLLDWASKLKNNLFGAAQSTGNQIQQKVSPLVQQVGYLLNSAKTGATQAVNNWQQMPSNQISQKIGNAVGNIQIPKQGIFTMPQTDIQTTGKLPWQFKTIKQPVETYPLREALNPQSWFGGDVGKSLAGTIEQGFSAFTPANMTSAATAMKFSPKMAAVGAGAMTSLQTALNTLRGEKTTPQSLIPMAIMGAVGGVQPKGTKGLRIKPGLIEGYKPVAEKALHYKDAESFANAMVDKKIGIKGIKETPKSTYIDFYNKVITKEVGGVKPVAQEIKTFEQFANENNAPRFSRDVATDKLTGAKEGLKERISKQQLKVVQDNAVKRELLRKEYDLKIASGEIRPPTKLEELQRIAQGNPDNLSVQAAKRLLEKYKTRSSIISPEALQRGEFAGVTPVKREIVTGVKLNTPLAVESFPVAQPPLGEGGVKISGITNLKQKQTPLPLKPSLQKPQVIPSTAGQNMESSLEGIIPQGKIRGFPETVIDTKGIPKEISDFAKTQTYEPLKNAEVLKTVSKIVKKGDSQAISFAKTDETVNGNATAMVMLRKLIDKGRIDEANDLIAAVSPRFTKQGQEIQILSQFSKLKPEGAIRWAQSLIEKANKANPRANLKLTPQNTEMIISRAKALEKLTDGSREKIVATAELIRDIHGVIPSSIGQKIATIQTMAQLLNPKTIIRNIGGNTIFAGLENISDVVGTGIDKGTSLFTGSRSKVLPSLRVQGKGLWQGLKEGAMDAAKGIDTSGGVNTQFDLPHRTFTGKWNPLTYLEKTLNMVLRAPDRAAFKATYNGSLDNQVRAAGTTKPTPKMIETAFADGLYRTFQDNSRLAQIFSGAKKLLNKIGTPDGKFGLGDLILKYPKTPANLLSRGLDYSPVGFFKGVYQAVRPLLTGQPFEQKAFVEAISRGMVGTGIISAGYILAQNGILSGRPAKDYDIAAMQREQGSGPFRINVDALQRYFLSGKPQTSETGDNLVSFDWAQPGSLPLAMGANMQINPKGQDQFTAAIEQLDAGASTLTQQSMVQGVTNLAKDIGQYGPVRAGTNAVLGSPSGFVPTLSNQLVQATDNVSRETYDPSAPKQALNKVISRIPGVEQQLPAKIGVLGKPLERFQGGSNNIFNVFFNPAFVSKISENPTAKEVIDIYNRSGETQQAPRLVDRKITINGREMVLTPEQVGKYQTYVGQKADEAIKTVMNDPVYQKASDDDKAKFIANILTDINSAAKIELFGNRPKNVSKKVENIIGGTFTTPDTSKMGGLDVVLNKEGNLSLSNITQDLIPPKLTGLAEVDKKLISKFNGEITQRGNDLMERYLSGKMTADELDKALTELKTLKSNYAAPKKPKKPKKVTIKIPKMKKVPTIKFAKSKVKKIKMAKIKPIKITKAKTKKIKISGLTSLKKKSIIG